MDFGIIVDGAVIVVEKSSAASSHEHGQLGSFKELVAEAAAEVGRPTFFSMLIIIIAHIPIFTLQRHEGRIFAPMAYTITSALIGSLLFSLTWCRCCACTCCARRRGEGELHRPVRATGLPARAEAGARAAEDRAGCCRRWPWSATLMLVPQLGSEFLPELNEGSIWINFTLPPGIAPGEVNRTLHQVRDGAA